MDPLRIGAIPFLNSLPLLRGLEKGEGRDRDYVLHYAAPSALADLLRAGELDAGLIPAVEFLRGVGDGIVPGLCISSRGPAESIRLIAREPLGSLPAVLVDQASRSSVAMLRILLDRCHRVSPDFLSYRPDPQRPFLGPDGLEAAAALIIGDPAMAIAPDGIPAIIDLGAWWQSCFHRPFIYALWVYRERDGQDIGGRLVPLLEESFAAGMRDLPALCEEAAAARCWPFERVHEYLTRRMYYDLDAAALEGLETFRRLCVESHLATQRSRVVGVLERLGDKPLALSRSAG